MAGQLETRMWELLYAGQYQDLKRLIETNPEAGLFAAVDVDTDYNMPISLIGKTIDDEVKPRDFLLYVLHHPQVDWSYDNLSTARKLLDAFLADGDDSIIKGLEDVSGFIFSGNKLTYSLAVEIQNKAEKTLKERKDKGRAPLLIAEAEATLAQAKKMVALIRDITILFAIKTDNANLFELLAQAGGKPLDLLGDFGKKENPPFLFNDKQPNPRLKAWQRAAFERDTANRDEEIRELSDRLQRHGLFQAKVDQINAEHDAKTTAILAKAGSDRIDRIERAHTILTKVK